MSVHAESAERTGRSGARKAERGDDRAAAIAGLDLLRAVGWLVLHDVAVPGDAEVPIDHVLAGPSGVYAINTIDASGAIRMDDHSLLVGGASQFEHVEYVTAAAHALREVIGGRPVVPILCFQRHDEVAGVVAKVAVCSTENILELLNGQPKMLDAVTANEVMRTLNATLSRQTGERRVLTVAEAPVEVKPRHREKSKGRKRLLGFGRSDGDGDGDGTPELSTVAPVIAPEFPQIDEAAAEAARVEAERVAVEPARVEAERLAAEAARAEAERRAAAEAAKAEEAARAEAARVEAARVEAERLAAEEAARVEAERLAAERRAAAAAAAAARAEAARVAAERVEVERLAAEEAARAEAERFAAEEAERLAADRLAAERLAAEQLAAEEAAQAEAVRIEAERVEAERLAAEEAAWVEAQRRAAERAALVRAVETTEVAAEAEVVEAPPVVRQTRGRDSEDPVWRPIGPAAKRVDMKSAIKMVSAAFARHDEEPEFDLAEIETAFRDEEPAAKSSLPAWFGTQTPATAAARTDSLAEEAPARKRKVPFMPAVVAAAVIAVIIGVAPRVPDAYAWGKSFFVTPPPPSLGQTTVIAQTPAHPAIQMMAGVPLTVKSANGVTAGKGRHLVGVPIHALVQGSTQWTLSVAGGITLVDTLGVSHTPATKVTKVGSGKVLPKRITLLPGRMVAGMVVFAVENGREVGSVRVALTKTDPASVWNAGGSAN